MTGVKISQLTGTDSDKVCDIVVKRGDKTVASAVTFKNTLTTVITDIDPPFGSSAGSDSIHLTGTNFGSDVAVMIDGVECVVSSQTATDVYCTTGMRASPPAEGNSFIVTSDGN